MTTAKRVLPEGAKLLLIDDLSPEDLAMLQALYSRSAESAETHLEKVKKNGSGKFMGSFYVGYGHKSIADCGTTTMFIEGVSLLAAKAIQDWPLYSGQETSTRYIDMGKQRIEDPLNTPESQGVLYWWMNFYRSKQDAVASHVRATHPAKQGEKPDVYEKAVTARTFDILRGFLPAGITTQLSWHSNLRQSGDHLLGLVNHPSPEICNIGMGLRELLGEAYPSSGAGMSLAAVSGVGNSEKEEADKLARKGRTEWERKVALAYSYNDLPVPYSFKSTIQRTELAWYEDLLRTRPRGCVLPHFLSDLGQLTFSFPLDFGSFRDLQRHRNGVCRMPLLTTQHGFEPWYLEQLPRDVLLEATHLIGEQTKAIEKLTKDPVLRQYYTALGFRVPCSVTYALPAAVYVMELRSGKTIHPTLRRRVHEMIQRFQKELPQVPIHVDLDQDDWDIRRGNQTIIALDKS